MSVVENILNANDRIAQQNFKRLEEANFQLGTHKTILVASVPEGDDKPYKYPGTYRGVDVLVINKIDLLPYVNFRMDYFERGVQALNPGVTAFHTSCTTGEGLDAWADWLIEQAKQ
jgi:hydrogenase nickel incorporation protein HypB